MSPRGPVVEQPPVEEFQSAPEVLEPMARGPRWPVGIVVVGVLAALGIALVWFFAREEPAVDTPEQPGAAVEEPEEPAPEIVYGQEPRANWDVTGVAAADQLNVRTGPGAHNTISATLAPDTVELESTGRIARVDGVLWREIIVPGDGTGWVNARYLTETRPPVLTDGRHAVYLTGIDVEKRTLTADVIQFLTGEEAVAAYHEEFPDDPDGPPNDYWILNVNPALRTLPVSTGVTVRLVRLAEDGDADLDAGTWAELPTYLADYKPEDARLSWNPFWLDVDGDVIIRIEEQYLP